jgi:hypothetical protein
MFPVFSQQAIQFGPPFVRTSITSIEFIRSACPVRSVIFPATRAFSGWFSPPMSQRRYMWEKVSLWVPRLFSSRVAMYWPEKQNKICSWNQ